MCSIEQITIVLCNTLDIGQEVGGGRPQYSSRYSPPPTKSLFVCYMGWRSWVLAGVGACELVDDSKWVQGGENTSDSVQWELRWRHHAGVGSSLQWWKYIEWTEQSTAEVSREGGRVINGTLWIVLCSYIIWLSPAWYFTGCILAWTFPLRHQMLFALEICNVFFSSCMSRICQQ